MKLDIANFLSKITLEPTVFTLYFGIQLEKGARITTDLLFNQVCHYEQNNTQEICASLTNGSFEGKCSNTYIRPIGCVMLEYIYNLNLLVRAPKNMLANF